MTINDTTDTRDEYTASASQTTFPYTFWIKETSDLAVYVNGTLKTLTTDYTVSTIQDPNGGNVIFNSGLTANDVVVITYEPSLARATDFLTSGNLKASALNLELDYLISLNQYLRNQNDRTIRISDTATGSITTTITPSANDIIGWNSTGTALQNVSITSANIDTAVTAIDQFSSNYEKITINGDGAETNFSFTETLTSANAVYCVFNDVPQIPGTDFTISGTDVVFTTAPTNSQTGFAINYAPASSASIATVSDGSITTAKLANSAVTNAKIDKTVISGQTDTTVTAADSIVYSDADDSSNLKKDTVQGILDLVTVSNSELLKTSITGQTDTAIAAGDSIIFSDASDSDNLKKDTVQGLLDLVTGGGLQSAQVFTASGTWTKPAGITKVIVMLCGGGGGGGVAASGGNGSGGGTTSFGAHCSATGGDGGGQGPSGSGGSGGTGSSGDVNGSGHPGSTGNSNVGTTGGGTGGAPTLFGYGRGGNGGAGNGSGGGGGGGGVAIKTITSGLGATETVTIGSGGSGATAGQQGVCYVLEFA